MLHLRLELHLMLWVTAAVLTGMIVFHGDRTEALLASDEAGELAVLQRALPGSNTAQTIYASAVSGDQSNAPVASSKTIFSVPSSAPLPHIEQPVPHRVLPVLKGIISIGDEKRAIFLLQPDTGSYVSAGLGEAVDGLRIETIDNGHVVAADTDGVAHSFVLRGAGEG